MDMLTRTDIRSPGGKQMMYRILLVAYRAVNPNKKRKHCDLVNDDDDYDIIMQITIVMVQEFGLEITKWHHMAVAQTVSNAMCPTFLILVCHNAAHSLPQHGRNNMTSKAYIVYQYFIQTWNNG